MNDDETINLTKDWLMDKAADGLMREMKERGLKALPPKS